MIQLDDGRLSFIYTPLYTNISALRLYKVIFKEKKPMCKCATENIKELSYEAKHDIGQEKSASSLQWTFLFDMVLKWINSQNR
jgi:hypothetical protein